MTAQLTAISKAMLAAVLAVLVAAAAGFGGVATASSENLRDGLFRTRPQLGRSGPPPVIARYVSEDGASFVLDRSQARPLLKFENNPEVWVLLPQPAPRGDVIYKNDLGEPLLRATRLGGVTLFTPQRPGGTAAALAGGGDSLRLPPMGPQALLERLGQASTRASRAARRLIPFDAEATPDSSALIGDAAVVVTEAVVRMVRGGEERALRRIEKVKLTQGRRPAVQLERGSLLIIVAPGMGLAGRPSSDRIIAAARDR